MNDTATLAHRIMNATDIDDAKSAASNWLTSNGIEEFSITTADDTYNEMSWHTEASNAGRCADAAIVLLALYTRQNRG